MKSKIFAVLALSASLAGWASEPLTLTFQRTGTDASSVTVTSSLEGVTATLTSVSHALKASAEAVGSENLCADVNGNTSPTIVYSFSISGIPSGWSANQIGLDITGYNAGGKRQASGDNVKRQFNVAVAANGSQIASYTDLDPAAGVANAQKVWETALTSTLQPGANLQLTITVTKGTDNQGCFFGLNGITLSTDENVDPNPPTPPTPPTPSNNKIYTIKWKNNTDSYMTAMPDGSIQIGAYSETNRVFWEFIATDKEDCYYIRNTANKMYIGSCNMQPSSNSHVMMSVNPVEYYVHISAATEGQNKDCYWLSSTDCANYSTETSGARCLNKDGASSYIITWTSGIGNVGSYWSLTESEDLYEAKPFSSENTYYILDSERRAYSYSGQWVAYNPFDENARWRFEGTGNKTGGYTIINAKTNEAINSGVRYQVVCNGSGYSFIDANGGYLNLGGQEIFTFIAARSKFALNNRIYQMPCGMIADTWISSVSTGDFHYPMATVNDGALAHGTVTSKPNKYVILSRDAILAAPGSALNLAITLNKVPSEQYTLIAFADFDHDGYFEYSVPVTIGQNCTAEIAVPENAKLGECRLRLRLNSNGMNGPDDDVMGEILDLRLNVANLGTELVDPVVKPNDPKRGEAQWKNNLATATSKGNAMFLYWKDGVRIVSTQPEYAIEPAALPHVLTAMFSANTDLPTDIDPVILNKINADASIVFNGTDVSVAGAEADAIIVFALNGQIAASTSAKVLDIANLPSGVYIAKAITSTGIVSSKIVK